MDSHLNSLPRRLIELRIEHGDLDGSIDRLGDGAPQDQLLLRRLKKRRLVLRDRITQIEREIDPPERA